MSDLWQNRIALNPKISISTTVPGASGGDGTLDRSSDTGGMSTHTISPSMAPPSKAAPKNPPTTWSAGD